jgi:predicted RNA-binding protein YlqC (UPF0109 family)
MYQRQSGRPRDGGRRGPRQWGGGGRDYRGDSGTVPALTGLIEFVAYGLVRNVDAVQVRELVRSQAVVYELRVAEEDKGRVIGKDGRIAQALRTVMRAAAGESSRRVALDII